MAEEAWYGEPEGEDAGGALGHDGDEGHGVGSEAGGKSGGKAEGSAICPFDVFQDDVERVRLAIPLTSFGWEARLE